MSFFRDYLERQNQVPDLRFNEIDENWFIFALVLIRFGLPKGTWNLITGRGENFRDNDPLASMLQGAETSSALKFVSTFLCFFVPKPPKYHLEIENFKSYFTPGFFDSAPKQQELFDRVLPIFATTPLEEAKWDTVEQYFRPEPPRQRSA